MYWRAQQQKVDSTNVNADWDDTTNSVVPAAERKDKVDAAKAEV
jgi:PiT family inorganic phosphate transporter